MIQEWRRMFLTYFNNGYDTVNEDLSEAIAKKNAEAKASAWFKIVCLKKDSLFRKANHHLHLVHC